MNDSMAQPWPAAPSRDLPGWKTSLSWVAAVLIALLFLASGIWKITDAQGAAVRMAQAKVPQSLSLAAALLFGIAETVGGVLILVPRLRRWGSAITALLLAAFLIYVAMNYKHAARRGVQLLPVDQARGGPWILHRGWRDARAGDRRRRLGEARGEPAKPHF